MDSRHSIHDESNYEYYPLDVAEHTLHPHEHEIVVNIYTGHAMLIDWEQRQVRADVTFLPHQLPLMLTLLDKWPSYVEYEKLIPLLIRNPQLAEQIMQCIEIARQQEPAERTTMLNVMLAPLRDTLQACHERLRSFGIAIVPVYENGYLLAPPGGEPEEQES